MRLANIDGDASIMSKATALLEKLNEQADLTLWLARDKDGTLTLFENKPVQKFGSWVDPKDSTSNHSMFLDEDLYSNITWQDSEPTILMCKLKKN